MTVQTPRSCIDKTFVERKCVLLFNLRHVIHIPSYRIANLQCCGNHFSSTTFIDAKTKYKKSLSLGRLSALLIENHIRTSSGRPRDVCRRRPQDVCRGRPLELHIGHYGDVLRTLHWDFLRTSYFIVQRASVKDVLRTLAGDVPWRYIEDHMGTSIGRLLGTSSGRNFAEWVDLIHVKF